MKSSLLRSFAAALLSATLVGAVGCANEVELDDETATRRDPGEDEGGADEVGQISESVSGGSGMTIGTHFVDLAGTETEQKALLRHLLQLIRQEREEIRLSVFLIDNEIGLEIAQELRAARQRGVDVKIVGDGLLHPDEEPGQSSGPTKHYQAIQAIFAAIEAKGDYKNCRGACIATNTDSRMHAKLALFKKQKLADGSSRDHVVWIGSANLKDGSGWKMYNNSLTVAGSEKFFDSMHAYFHEMWSPPKDLSSTRHDYYAPSKGRGYAQSRNEVVKAHMSPNNVDLVAERLANVSPAAGCEIRVVAAQLSAGRDEVFAKLDELGQGGCEIWVTGNEGYLAQAAEKDKADPLAKLRANAAAHGYAKRLHTSRIVGTHDKIITIKGNYLCGHPGEAACDSKKPSFIVLAGSHNLVKSSNFENDEILVVVSHEGVYKRYAQHAARQYNRGKRD